MNKSMLHAALLAAVVSAVAMAPAHAQSISREPGSHRESAKPAGTSKQVPLYPNATRAEPKHQPDVTNPGVSPASISQNTRLSPLTAMTGNAAIDSPSLQISVTHEELAPAPVALKSKLPLVLAGTVGVLVLAVIGYFAFSNKTPEVEPQPDPTVKVDPPKTDPVVKVDPPTTDPVKVDPPKTDPVVNVDPPKTDPVVKVEPPKVDPPKNDPVKPKSRAITNEQLVSRLKKIEGQLATKEAETGQKDNVLRQFIDQARKDIKAATSDGDRKEVWSFLGDIEGQLKR